MKVRLTILLDSLRGGAWPPSVRAVRCSVKSDNERDPRCQLLISSPEGKYSDRTATDKVEEGVGNGRSVCPESPGLHADYNDWNNGLRLREEKLIPKSSRSSDRALKLVLVKPESLVIGCH